MLTLHLREFEENDLLNMQSSLSNNNGASFPAAPKTAAPGVHLPTNVTSAAFNGVVAHHLAETAQYEE